MKTAKEIADFVGGTLHGDPDAQVDSLDSLEGARVGSLAYADASHLEQAAASNASCLLVPEARLPDRTVVVVAEPKLAFAQVARWLRPFEAPFCGVDETAIIRDGADVAADTALGAWVVVERGASVGGGSFVFPGCYIGEGSRVGRDCVLYPNVVLYPGAVVSDRTIIHAGAVIGSDGFGFVVSEGRYVKIPQLGRVQIGADVEVGANSTIDRGALDDTAIDDGTKIDNLCQIAHNVRIGSHTIMSSQSGIAGSSSVGHHAVIGGQVGIADHCRIGNRAVLGAHTGIPTKKRVPDGEIYWGSPARPLKEGKRLQAHLSRLPRMSDDIKQLRVELEELKQRLSEL